MSTINECVMTCSMFYLEVYIVEARYVRCIVSFYTQVINLEMSINEFGSGFAKAAPLVMTNMRLEIKYCKHFCLKDFYRKKQ